MTSFKIDGRHGYGPYTQGCRCDVCREAKRQRQQQIRARRDFANLTHGKKSTYDNGCKCDPCRKAKADADYLDYWKHHEARRESENRRHREQYWRKKTA